MKKVLKNPIFMFILGVVLTSGIAVTASQIFASSISFTPSNPNWVLENNNVEEAINDLYSRSNLSFDQTLYEEYMGDAASHSKSIELGKGRYIVSVLHHYQMANPSDQISDINEAYSNILNLTCESDNCVINNLSGYTYHPVSSSSVFSNGYYIHSHVHLSNFYVEIKENTDELETSLDLSWSTDGLSEVVALQAIPIR